MIFLLDGFVDIFFREERLPVEEGWTMRSQLSRSL